MNHSDQETSMKILAALALSFIVAGPIQGAQDRSTPAADSKAAPAAQTKIDPGKEADIRRLLDMTGTAALAQQVMDSMEQSLRPMIASSLPPGAYRDKLLDLFFQKFRSKLDSQRLIDLAVARYDENFSDEEIKGLMSFYATPLGRKVITQLPKITAQLQQDGENLGQKAGRDAMIEVLSEHPDIAQALQQASSRSAPPSQ
jgi:uncharacterized protein